MGAFLGHALTGMGFIVIGVWHLFNHLKLHALRPDSYYGSLWFPTAKIRYLELYLIMFGTSILIATELFFLPRKHHPFASDGSIPSNHLPQLEHSVISATIFTYAVFAILLDKANPRTKTHAQVQTGLAQLVGAVAFGQQLLLLHFHSTDHNGVESQYHMLLQIIICICLVTTLIGIAWPKSFLVCFVRSVSVLFQGIWLVVMGFMLWTPGMCPKGCYLMMVDGHYVMHCRSHEALHRAKALVNIQFSCYVILIVVFTVALYLAVDKVYGGKGTEKYSCTLKEVEGLYKKEDSDDYEIRFIDDEEETRSSNLYKNCADN